MAESKELKMTKEVSEIKERNRFLSRVYLWMTAALVISGGVAFTVSVSPQVVQFLFGYRMIPFIVLCVLEIVLVYWLSAKIRTMKVATAVIGFILYSVVNGLTLSAIFLVYNINSIFFVFLISAALFAVMALYGSITKTNLKSVGRYLFMGLVGLLIVSVVNIFLKSARIDWIVSIVTVLVFTGLTAYDAQKLLKASEVAESQEEDVFQKASILGALELYLDFINIFLALLRLFGKRK